MRFEPMYTVVFQPFSPRSDGMKSALSSAESDLEHQERPIPLIVRPENAPFAYNTPFKHSANRSSWLHSILRPGTFTKTFNGLPDGVLATSIYCKVPHLFQSPPPLKPTRRPHRRHALVHHELAHIKVFADPLLYFFTFRELV